MGNLSRLILLWLCLLALSFCLADSTLKNPLKPKNAFKESRKSTKIHPRRLFKPRLEHNLNVTQYDLRIHPYFPAAGVIYDTTKNFTFDGYTKITFTMLQDAVNVSVDVKNLNFYSISLTQAGIRQELISAQVDNSTSRLVIVPVWFFTAGKTYELEFDYSGLINPTAGNNTGGLFFTTFEYGGKLSYIIATHMETGIYGTPSVFPCFDDPGFKARFNVTLIHPQSMVVLANMLENSTGEIYGNGYNITNFPLTHPMSTYLVAFAMGDLVSKQNYTSTGVLHRVWSWRGAEPYMDFSISSAVACFEVLQTYTNYSINPYPMNKLDHLALPSFPVGGQENWGLIIYEYTQVLFDPDTSTTQSKMYAVGTKCHEMSHQWFGDLVTNTWWSEIILHEGIARFFEYYAPGLTYPNQANFEFAYFVPEWQEVGLMYDEGPVYNQPWHPLIGQATSFNDVFTTITYEKGSSIFRMLSATMGQENFKLGMQMYLQKYKFGNADHVEYFDVMTEIAQEANLTDWCQQPLDVNQLMNNWVTQLHFPAIRVAYNPLNEVYEAYQEPYLPLEYLPSGYNYTWNIPMPIMDQNGVKTFDWLSSNPEQCSGLIESASADKKKSQKLKYPSISDFIQVYNDESTTFARAKYDDASFGQILKLVKNNPTEISTATKNRLFFDEWAWVYENLTLGIQPVRFDRVMSILQIFHDNSSISSTTWNTLDNQIYSFFNFLMQLFMDRNENDLFMKALNPILENFYSGIGKDWNNATDSWDMGILQQDFLPNAILFGVGDARKTAVDYFQQVVAACKTSTGNFTKCNPLKPDIRQAVYCGAAWSANQTTYDELTKHLGDAWASQESVYFDQEILNLEQGLGCLQDPNLIQMYIRFLVNQKKYYPLRYFQFNNLASQVMVEMLQTNPSFILHKSSDSFADYLFGMTYLWGSQKRLDQLISLKSNISSLMSTHDMKAMNNTIIGLADFIEPANTGYYPITRWLYDTYIPYGPTPWKALLPNNTLEALSYDVHLQPYFPSSYSYPSYKNFTFDGTVSMTLKTLKSTSKIIINSHRHIINGTLIMSNGNHLNHTSISRDYENTFLNINLAYAIPENTTFTVTIDYSGFIYQNPSDGAYMNTGYLEMNGKKSWIFGTNFEDGPGTRSLVPCLDEPSYKATWHVTVDYPSDLVALGNMIEESMTVLNDGRTRTTFKQTPPMSSYLLALSIGDFASLRSITPITKKLIRVWTWEGMQDNAQLALDVLGSTVDFMSTYFNYTLPLDKYDVLALPQFTGAIGAMENWGLVIGNYVGMLFDKDYDGIYEKTHVNEIVAHEIVHHWFGDLVSPKWWRYIFLNEGFASYFYMDRISWAYQEQSDYADYERFYNSEHALLVEEFSGILEPAIVPSEQELGQPGTLGMFGNQVYDKAAAVLHMLSNTIGNATFQAGLQQYLKNYALLNADDSNLWNTLTSFVQNASVLDWNGSPLDVFAFMKAYTYQNMFPLLRVVTSPDGTQFSYQQQPYLSSQNFSGYQWPIPISSMMDGNRKDFNWLNSQNSFWTSKNYAWRVDNVGRKAYARVFYDDAAWAPIQEQIKKDFRVFDPVTRAQFLGDTFALARQGLVPWKRLLDLTLYLKDETDLIPFSMFFTQNAAGQYSSQYLAIQETLLYNFKFQPEFPLVKKYLNYILDDGTTPFGTTGHWNTDLLYPYFSSSLCYLGQKYCNQKAGKLFQNFISNCQNSLVGTGPCNSVAPQYRQTQFCYGLRQNPSYYYVLENFLESAQNDITQKYFGNDIQALLFGLSCVENDEFINKYIDNALKNIYPSDIFQYIALNDPSGMRLFNFFNSSRIIDVVHSSNFGTFLQNMAFSWSTSDQLFWLQNFNWSSITLTSAQVQAWNSTIQSVIDRQIWLAKNQPQISAWLKENFGN